MAELLGQLSCTAWAGQTDLEDLSKISNSSVLTCSRLMSCSMRNEQILCKVKIFQLQSMSNEITFINQRFAVKKSGISCLALIFVLSNLRRTILHYVAGCETLQVIYSFFSKLTRTHGLVVKVSHSLSGCSGLIPALSWNSLPSSPGPWAWALEKSLMRPSFFLYFREIRKKRSHWPGGQSAPRLYNSYNLCPCARPAHVGECWPGP